MAYKNNAKFGFQGFTMPAPKELSPFEKIKWQMEQAKELGCTLYSYRPFGLTPEETAKLAELKAEYGFESEGFMTPAIFQLAGWDKMVGRDGKPVDAVKAKETLEQACEQWAKEGTKIVRAGYGRLCYAFSRWNRDPEMSGERQLENLIECYKIADPILAKYGVYFAQENHLDFKGCELDYAFTTAGVTHIGCAYDTANGFFVNLDPNDDIPYLSKWAITTHIKDSKVIDSPFNGPDGPMIVVGCGLGEGNVDVKAAVDAILENAIMKDGIHLIFESGWFGKQVHDENPDMDEYNRQVTRRSIKWLQDYVTIK